MAYEKKIPIDNEDPSNTLFVDGETVLAARHMNQIQNAIRYDEAYINDEVAPHFPGNNAFTAETGTFTGDIVVNSGAQGEVSVGQTLNSISPMATGAIRYNDQQSLTYVQKAQAKDNIDVNAVMDNCPTQNVISHGQNIHDTKNIASRTVKIDGNKVTYSCAGNNNTPYAFPLTGNALRNLSCNTSTFKVTGELQSSDFIQLPHIFNSINIDKLYFWMYTPANASTLLVSTVHFIAFATRPLEGDDYVTDSYFTTTGTSSHIGSEYWTEQSGSYHVLPFNAVLPTLSQNLIANKNIAVLYGQQKADTDSAQGSFVWGIGVADEPFTNNGKPYPGQYVSQSNNSTNGIPLNGITVSRRNNCGIINGTVKNTSSTYHHISINGGKNGGIKYGDTSTANNPDFVYPYKIYPANHIYKVTAKVVSGQYTRSQQLTKYPEQIVVYYQYGEGNVQARNLTVTDLGLNTCLNVNGQTEFATIFSPTQDMKLGFGFITRTYFSFDNFTVEFNVEDITETLGNALATRNWGIATVAYTTGQLLVNNGKLYYANKPIAQYALLSDAVDGNITTTTISSEIANLKSELSTLGGTITGINNTVESHTAQLAQQEASIGANTSGVAANVAAIEANASAISANETQIANNNELIKSLQNDDNLIDYKYQTNAQTTTVNGLTIERKGTTLKLNGTPSSGTTYIRLGGPLNASTSKQASMMNANYGVSTVSGYKYILVAKLISGTTVRGEGASGSGPRAVIYQAGTTTSIFGYYGSYDNDTGSFRYFDGGDTVVVCFIADEGFTFTNAVYDIQLKNTTYEDLYDHQQVKIDNVDKLANSCYTVDVFGDDYVKSTSVPGPGSGVTVPTVYKHGNTIILNGSSNSGTYYNYSFFGGEYVRSQAQQSSPSANICDGSHIWLKKGRKYLLRAVIESGLVRRAKSGTHDTTVQLRCFTRTRSGVVNAESFTGDLYSSIWNSKYMLTNDATVVSNKTYYWQEMWHAAPYAHVVTIAEDQDVAESEHALGDYVLVSGTLYVVTDENGIAIGDTIAEKATETTPVAAGWYEEQPNPYPISYNKFYYPVNEDMVVNFGIYQHPNFVYENLKIRFEVQDITYINYATYYGQYYSMLDNGNDAEIRKYTDLMMDCPTTDIESFLFFTDQHITGENNWRIKFADRFRKIGEIYEKTPVDFCVFAGDILPTENNTSVTKGAGMLYMAWQDKMCKNIFGRYYPTIGNHDTNYLSNKSNPELSWTNMTNATMRGTPGYYCFEGNNTTIYMMNTWKNVYGGSATYEPRPKQWEEIHWFAQHLLDHNPKHAIVAMHIIVNNNEQYSDFPVFTELNKIAEAFNNGTACVVQAETESEHTYDYQTIPSEQRGRVEFFLGGHLHSNGKNIVRRGMPCIMRRNLQFGKDYSSDPTFDLVLCDWGGRRVYFKQFGYNAQDLLVDISDPNNETPFSIPT